MQIPPAESCLEMKVLPGFVSASDMPLLVGEPLFDRVLDPEISLTGLFLPFGALLSRGVGLLELFADLMSIDCCV